MKSLLLILFISTIIVLSAPFFLKNNSGDSYINLSEMESFNLPIYRSLIKQAIRDKTALLVNSNLQKTLDIQPQQKKTVKKEIIRWQDADGQWHFSNEKPFIPTKVTRPKVMDDNTPLPDPTTINSIPATKLPNKKNGTDGNSNSENMRFLIPIALLIVVGFFVLIILKTLLRHFADQARIKKERESSKKEQPKREYAEYKAISVTTLNPYAVLGVTPVSNIDEIKSAYKSLIRQYHPDKVDNLGEDLKAVALEKTAEINNAYELIKEQKGF